MTALQSWRQVVNESQTIIAHLRTLRLPVGDESSLQSAVWREIQALGIACSREHRFDKCDRVDFLTAGGLAIELKVDGTRNAAMRQLMRYAEQSAVESLLLITSRSRHLGMPATLRGKPLTTYHVLAF